MDDTSMSLPQANRVLMFLPKEDGYGEAYPYGPSDAGFHTDLGILFPAERHFPALAIVDGDVGLITGQKGVCTLVLRPEQPLNLKLPWMPGQLDVVFIYRNMDGSNIDFGPAGFRRVKAGEPLGDVAYANQEAMLLGFEIAFVPRAFTPKPDLDPGRELIRAAGWVRLIQMIDPLNTVTRRLDPMAFYAALLFNLAHGIGEGEMDKLSAADAHHPLLEILTRRTLIEVRDEYDRPRSGTIDIRVGDVPTQYPINPAARGTMVVATAQRGEPATIVSYQLSMPSHLLSLLPSSMGANPTPDSLTFKLAEPSHAALQAIYMDDSDDATNWFVANLAPMPRFTMHNRVTAICDGIPAFKQMVAAIRTVQGGGNYLRLCGWRLVDDFELIPKDATSTFAALSKAVDNSGAQVQALLWKQYLPDEHRIRGSRNQAEVEDINELPNGNGAALLDNDTLRAGSHHQKILIVNGNAGAMAFCGGVDINPDRLDDDQHLQGLFHDVHAKIEGPAVADLDLTFTQRWNYDSDDRSPAKRVAQLAPMAAPGAVGTHIVQVSRTYAPQRKYPFASNGDLTTLNALRRAIQRAERFIYIEDQYLCPYSGPYPYKNGADNVGILEDLLAALQRPNFEYLIMMIPNHISAPPQYRYRRRNFIATLRKQAPGKVFAYYLVNSRDEEVYVHTKSWIVDDVYAMIGSANCCQRSFTHDSECSIHVVDEALLNGARGFARNYRMNLWAEHLNMQDDELRPYLEDPTMALSFWQKRQARQRVYKEETEIDMVNLDHNWNTVYDPDGRL